MWGHSSRGGCSLPGGGGGGARLFFCFSSALLSVEIFVAAALSVSIAKPFRLSSNLWPFCVLWLFVCSFFSLILKSLPSPLTPSLFPAAHNLRQFTSCDLWHIRAQCGYNVYKCVLIYDPPRYVLDPLTETCLPPLVLSILQPPPSCPGKRRPSVNLTKYMYLVRIKIDIRINRRPYEIQIKSKQRRRRGNKDWQTDSYPAKVGMKNI